jgi:acyl-CoA thioesterase I
MMSLELILFPLLILITLAGLGYAGLVYLDRHPHVPKVDQPGKRVACVGDSITVGMGVFFNHPEKNSYPALLQGLLGEKYQVLNYGHSSRTLLNSGDHPYRKSILFTASQNIEPSIVLILLGTNDSKPFNWNAIEYERQLTGFVETYKNLPSHPEVFLMTPCAAFGRGVKETIAYKVDNEVIRQEMIPIILRIAKQLNIPVIDIYSATRDHPEYFGDGIHPNVKGNKVLAETVYTALFKSIIAPVNR